MAEELLRLTGVGKTFISGDRPLEVLSGIDLTVLGGESVAVVGPSGSGKSTLLNLAAGLDSVTSGEVSLKGRSLSMLNDHSLSSLRLNEIGFIFQNHYLFAQCTALENVLMPTLPLGGGKAARQRAEELLGSVGLLDRKDHLPGQLSGGECSRVAFARSLINSPSILFADEPTGSLDSATAQTLTDLLVELNAIHGTALVVVTHSGHVADCMARRVTLREGRLVGA